MDKELFRKTEGKLYRYYKNLRFIQKLKRDLNLLNKQKNEIENEKVELKHLQIEVYSNMGIDYSKEKIQSSSSGIGEAERETMNYIDNLNKQLDCIIRKILKTKSKIREIEFEISDIEFNINMLSEESKRFIEWKYGEHKSVGWIAVEMYGGARSTAYRKREELVENINLWNNII